MLQALADKPSSRQSFLYTGPNTDLDAIQSRAGGGPGMVRPTEGQQRRANEENGGGPPRGDGPKMVSSVVMNVVKLSVGCGSLTHTFGTFGVKSVGDIRP